MGLLVSCQQAEVQAASMDSAHCTLKPTAAHHCHCPDTRRPDHGEGNPTLWRPWMSLSRDRTSAGQALQGRLTDVDSAGKKGALGFQHPVRLYMPKSKTEEYLQDLGKKVLSNFPVQATMHFYNDESEEEEDEEMDYYNYYQNYSFPRSEAGRATGEEEVEEAGSSVEEEAEEDPACSSGTEQSTRKSSCLD